MSAIAFSERYPTGRKHCSDCTCWRPVTDFTVHTWLDSAKTIPVKLLAYCRSCAAKRRRDKCGYKLRDWYRLGRRGTEYERIARNAERRQKYLIWRQDPEWVAARRAYQRKHNKPDPIIKKTGGNFGQLDGRRFVEYLNIRLVPIRVDHSIAFAQFVNGKRLSESETRALNRWRSGQHNVRLSTADEWAIKFDLPLWEIEEAAKMVA